MGDTVRQLRRIQERFTLKGLRAILRGGSKGGSLEGLRSPLFILVGVQTILVAALLFKTSALERRIDTAAGEVAPASESRPVAAAAPAISSSITVGDVRAILREELAALKPALAEGAPAPDPSPPRTAQTDRAYLDVQQSTRRLIAKGSATEAEMAALEMQIADLPAEQRRQALSAISRAVSNGTLDARF